MVHEPQTDIEELLDRCVDRLLAGEDWEACIPDGYADRDELLGMMRVAQQLAQVAESGWPEGPVTQPPARTGPRATAQGPEDKNTQAETNSARKRKLTDGLRRLTRGGSDWFGLGSTPRLEKRGFAGL